MSEICQFYNSSKIFITGATGFLGKILIEKLLRSTDVATIYILIRDKNGKNSNERLLEMFDDVIFERLRREKPKFYERIISINGNCAMAGLGLNQADRERLIADVTVVFHVAATVRFDENIKLAYAINIQGTESILDIAKQMNNLKAFIHVSTAYSHCHLSEIDEKFYDIPIDHDHLRHLLDKLTLEEAEKITPKLIGDYPNTYTFTKGIAENLVKKYTKNLPIAIFRPSIILSTFREPISGWTDSLNGPMGFSASVGAGLLHVVRCDQSKHANLVPVDMCANALIAIGWDVANQIKPRPLDHNCSIYNYVTAEKNPITWGETNLYLNINNNLYPYQNLIWLPNVQMINNEYSYQLRHFVFNILPIIFYDLYGKILGKKIRFWKILEKIHKMKRSFTYFTLNEWKFFNENTKNLWKNMNENDRQLFQFDMNELSWPTYLNLYIKGIRIYLLADPLETLPLARKKLKRLENIRNLMAYLMYFTILWFLWLIYRNI